MLNLSVRYIKMSLSLIHDMTMFSPAKNHDYKWEREEVMDSWQASSNAVAVPHISKLKKVTKCFYVLIAKVSIVGHLLTWYKSQRAISVN